MRVLIYDTTLRDGAQGESVYFSVDDKLRIVKKLDALGLDYIEGGWPGSNPKDFEFYQAAAKLKLKNAKLSAFGSTRRANNLPLEDKILNDLLATQTPVVTIFGKSWDFHASEVLKVTLAENLQMIEDSVSYLRQNNREVIFDAEHFFDGFKANPDYAIETLKAAARGGANTIVICDTNGGTLPLEAVEIFNRVKAEISLPIGVHFHNDSGTAVASSVMSVQAGAAQVQGTFNGYGERCGNANLSSIIPTLILKLGYETKIGPNLTSLTETSRFISELTNLQHDERQPYVGASAFAHKAGTHHDAIIKNSLTLEHVRPEQVGNTRRFLLSDQAGRSTILKKVKEILPETKKNDPQVIQLTNQLKELENLGYQFEAAEASFDLIIKKAFNLYEKAFNLEGFRIIVEKRGDQPVFSEATIKVAVGEQREITAAEGNGPVNALDCAIRKALLRFYPEISDINLIDYKVRVLEEKRGTAAKVRVLIQSSDGRRSWGTVGVSEDIIEASWSALVDSIEYGILNKNSVPKEEEDEPLMHTNSR
ncbi:MAG: citramalate synthase [Firmicutes bacterium]|nr:citramalate synthase [Bacillota bacterium]